MKKQILLVNPNTNATTTARMVAVAQRAAEDRFVVRGITAAFGAAIITNEAELASAGKAVAALIKEIPTDTAGLIVAAFGDPGIDELRARLSIPIIGIAEAGMRAAAEGGRSFAVVTTTPGLVEAIDRRAVALGLADLYRGVVLTAGQPDGQRGDVLLPNALLPDALPNSLLDDVPALAAALSAAVRRAIDELGVTAIVIGGGPLAEAAELLSDPASVAIIRPIPAAVGHLARLLER